MTMLVSYPQLEKLHTYYLFVGGNLDKSILQDADTSKYLLLIEDPCYLMSNLQHISHQFLFKSIGLTDKSVIIPKELQCGMKQLPNPRRELYFLGIFIKQIVSKLPLLLPLLNAHRPEK